MVTDLLLSSKVPEKRAATRYGMSVILRLEWGKLCGKGTEEERGVLEGEVKFCAVGEEDGIPVPSCSSASTTGQCFCRTNPCVSAKCNQLETEGEGGQTEGCASPHPSPPHKPFQHSKDSRFYTLTILCGIVLLSLGLPLHRLPMVLHSSTPS